MHEEPLPDNAIRSIIRRYYVVSACYVFGPLFIFAVYPLFLRSRGLDQLQINVVVAAYVLMTFLTDVPTGAFADAVGRRAAVVVGCSLHAAAFSDLLPVASLLVLHCRCGGGRAWHHLRQRADRCVGDRCAGRGRIRRAQGLDLLAQVSTGRNHRHVRFPGGRVHRAGEYRGAIPVEHVCMVGERA